MNLVRIQRGKDGRLMEFLGVEENLDNETSGKENWEGFSLFWAEPLPFDFFHCLRYARGLLRSSIVEAQKSCSNLNGGMLEHDLLRSSMAWHAPVQGVKLQRGLWPTTPTAYSTACLLVELRA